MKKIAIFTSLFLFCLTSSAWSNSYVEKFVTDKTNEKMKSVANDAFNKAMAKVAQKYNYGSVKFSEGLATALEEGKVDEALGHVKTLKSLWDDAVNDNWGSFAYTASKEALQKILPVSEYIFKYGEGYFNLMKGISAHVENNNLDFIRAVYIQEVLYGMKPKSKIITKGQVEAVRHFLSTNQMLECISAYSKDNCTSVLGKNRCGCVGYGLAQFMGKGSWLWKTGVDGAEADRALALFVRQDKAIAELLRNYVDFQENKDYFNDYENMLTKSAAYVEKKIKEAVQNETERVAAEQNRPSVQKKTVDRLKLSGSSEAKARAREAANDRYRSLSDQRKQYSENYSARLKELNDRSNMIYEKQKEIKTNFTIIYDELLPEPSIDETRVDDNRKKAEQFEQLAKGSELVIEKHRIEIEKQRLSLEYHSQTEPLSIEMQALDIQYCIHTYNCSQSGEIMTNSIDRRRAEVDRRVKQEEERIAQLQRNIPIIQKLAREYRAAADKGERLAREDAERIAALDLEKLLEQQRAYQEKMAELEKIEQEKNVDLDRLVDELVQSASSQESDKIVQRASNDLKDYAEKLDEYVKVSDEAMDSSSSYDGAYASAYLRRAGSTVPDVDLSNVIPVNPQVRPSSKMIIGFSRYLEAFAQANSYLEQSLGERVKKVEALKSTMQPLLSYRKAEMLSLQQELSALCTASADWSKAAKISRLEEFNNIFVRNKKLTDILNQKVQGYASTLSQELKSFNEGTFREYNQFRRGAANFSLPRIADRLSLHHQSESPHIMENEDLSNGVLDYEQTISGEGLVESDVALWVNGNYFALEREVDVQLKQATYHGDIPVEGMQKVLLRWDEQRADKVVRSGSAELSIPFSSAAVGDIEKLYQQFQQAYSGQDLYGLLRLVSEDWTAFDGTDIDDLETLLDNSFNVFDSIDYRIRGIKVRRRDDGNHEATYTIDLVGHIRVGNLTHEESSRITEVVGQVDGQWRILKTLAGQFWKR